MANIIAAYVCWFIGGPFGLHHFYLGRDRHAFVWWMSLGGLFLGWFRDLWRMYDYLDEANRDPVFLKRKRRHSKPPWKVVRFGGQLLIGTILGYLLRFAFPDFLLIDLNHNLRKTLFVILPVLGVSIGVSLVANIGIQKVAFTWCLIGAVFSTPFLIMKDHSIILAASFASLSASWKMEWDTDKEPPKGCCNYLKRTFVLLMCGIIYLSLWINVIYFNVHITANDGRKIPIHEAVRNFFESQAWRDIINNWKFLYDCRPAWRLFKTTMYNLYEHCEKHGWVECYNQLVEYLHPTGASQACEMLWSVHPPTQNEVRKRCRKLQRQYHPDKFSIDDEKRRAHEIILGINKACETLNDELRRRMEKNLNSVYEEHTEKTRQYKPSTRAAPKMHIHDCILDSFSTSFISSFVVTFVCSISLTVCHFRYI